MTSDALILSEESLQKEIGIFSDKLKGKYSSLARKEILRAVEWAHALHMHQQRASGEPYLIHPIKVAEILVDIKMDAVTIISAILHDVLEDTDIKPEEMTEEFGEEVTMLVEGVTKISLEHVKDKNVQKAETIRKMVLAMVKDIRVIFIKLADKRHNMNTLQYMAEDKQKRIAQECLEIFAPLAGKLGMNSLKSELEDLSLKFIDPVTYNRIKSFVDHKKEERAAFLQRVKEDIYRRASELRIKIEVRTRAKHFYSIYRKMKDKGKPLEEIYDILGVRILCTGNTECYTLLGLVHQQWPPIEGRFKDYIAMPKENNYQSLHTTVHSREEGRHLEVQIRTYEMNDIAEYGMAAHLIYKEKKSPKNVDPRNWQFVDKLKVLHQQGYDSSDFLNSLKRDILQDTIVVFTPQGDAKLLPVGSTAIDFAYHIHSQVGDHCSGARADGGIIPLIRPLRNTQTVQILTSPSAHPHIKWLKHVKTTSARSKIKNWLNKHSSSIIIDRNVTAKKDEVPVETVKPKDRVHNVGDVTQLRSSRHEIREREDSSTLIDKSRVGIIIEQEKDILIHLANCCNPVPGDSVIGYVSRGRGIIVHRSNCKNLKGIPEFEERKIHVEWETYSDKLTRSFQIRSRYTADLFSEVEGSIRKYGGHLISGSIHETERGDLDGMFTIETDRTDNFKKIVRSIRTIPSIIHLQRNIHGEGVH